jgi:hypothetical protein
MTFHPFSFLTFSNYGAELWTIIYTLHSINVLSALRTALAYGVI